MCRTIIPVKLLELTAYYNENDYPKYNGYDIINVNKLKDIPSDYNGIMGVPITFFDKYNHTQFQIVGIANSKRYIGDTKCYTIIGDRNIYQRVLVKLNNL
nr:MAG TPA: adenine-specific methyltransferase [Caudoviricetes sp.]